MFYCGIILLHIYMNAENPNLSTLLVGACFAIVGLYKKDK